MPSTVLKPSLLGQQRPTLLGEPRDDRAPKPTKWQRTAAILNEYNPIDAFWRLAGSPMASGGEISDQNIADGLMVGGTVMGGGAMIPKPANALNMGIRAFHGSPHSFDKFSMDKIGTGEGAQAYGHGLYFAENEGVAKGYRDVLTNKNVPQGKHIEKVAFNIVRNAPDKADVELAPFVRNVYPDATDSEIADALKVARSNQQPGSMYEVNINADPNHFLDWDKPLSEQSDKVRQWFDSRGITPGFAGQQSGAELFTAERGALGDAGVAANMRDAGLAGVKYLDHGSRFNAIDGVGQNTSTRNYVVFDDKLVSIVKKYGIAGASAMLGYNVLQGLHPAQAAELKKAEGK